MSIGLDLGSAGFRSLRLQGSRMIGRRCRACFARVPDTASQRRLLEQAGHEYVPLEDELILVSDVADEWSRLLQVPLEPLLPGGRLPAGNGLARQVTAALVEAVLPESVAPREVCCLTIPGSWGDEHVPSSELAYLTQLVRRRGYHPVVVGQSLALNLAELGDAAFTGLAATFGAASCEFSLAHQGRELGRFVFPRGGDWIDEQLATRGEHYYWDRYGERRLDVLHAAQLKEHSRVPVGPQPPESDSSIASLYAELVHSAVRDAARYFQQLSAVRTLAQPATLVYGGGLARAAGFGDLLLEALLQPNWPIPVRQTRQADPGAFTAARGCLIHAELEATLPTRSAA